MVARPGRLQSAFTAGELSPLLAERSDLKYFNAGMLRAENVQIDPQGGFRNRDGMRDLGAVNAAATRLFPFSASDGSSYDLVFSPLLCEVWGATAKLSSFTTGLTAQMLPECTVAQQLDTMLLFHDDLKPQRVKHSGPTSWDVDDAPLEEVPNYDYGETYTNGVPAVWQLEFVGLSPSYVTPASLFRLSVKRDTSLPIPGSQIIYDTDMTVLAGRVEDALLAHYFVSPGLTVVSASGGASGNRVRVSFSGAGNIPHNWGLTSDAGAAIAFYKVDEGDGSTTPEIWEIEFDGLSGGSTAGGSIFTLTVSGQETQSISYQSNMTSLALAIQTVINDLPNVAPGVAVASSSGGAGGTKVDITFSGDGNEGDGWAVSGNVVNKADAAVVSAKTTPGVSPGEPVISAERGWPHCGLFYAQRLLIGGFKSLPNAWMFSVEGNYFNFDQRFTAANGPALVPMDAPGGERIERLVDNRNLLIFTSFAEYWIAERAIKKTEAPNHVQASRHGTRRGVPIVENEGAAMFIHPAGNVLSELRYTDVQGNFASTDLSLLAPHLMDGIRDQAARRTASSTSGNLIGLVNDDGDARLISILREQEVTGFSRMSSPPGTFIAVNVNGRNEMSWIVERPDARRLERFEEGLLLDGAVSFTYGVATAEISGLTQFEGQVIWAIGDGHVFGPYTVEDAAIALPIGVSEVTVGYWSPPSVTTLPPPRSVAKDIVIKRRGRIHSVLLSVIDTTSIAIATNGGKMRDIDLVRWGVPADVPELDAPFTGTLKMRGLTGFADDPTVTISQLRPGRMTVRSITIEAAL